MGQPTAYNITTDFSSEVDAGTVGATNINSTKVDTELNNVETTLDSILVNIALSQADDGSPKDDWVDLPSLADDALAYITTNGHGFYAADTGSANTLVVTLDPAAASYTTGLLIMTKVNVTNNNTAVTLNVNALGTKAVHTDGSGSLPAVGALVASTLYGFQYDGTRFQVVFSGASAADKAASAASATASASSATASASSATASASSATAAAASETAAETAETNAETAQTAAENAAGSVAWQFKFDTSTSMADPGAGDFRMDSATVSAIRNIAFDATLSSTSTPDISAYIATWGASDSTIKGHLTIIQEDTPANFIVFSISSAVTDNTGWLQVVVNAAVASGGSLFGSTKECRVTFTRTGDKGTTGDTGATGAQGVSVGLNYRFNTATTDADKDSGDVWLNAAAGSETVLYFDNADTDGNDVQAITDILGNNSNSTARCTILIKQKAAPTENWIALKITAAVTGATGYSKYTCAHLTKNGTVANNDLVSVEFSIGGANGAINDIVDDTSPELGGDLIPGSNFIGMTKGGDISSASPLVIDTDGDYFIVSGTTSFSEMTVAANRHFFLEFAGILTITHGGGTIDIPGAANYTSVASDVIECVSTAADDVTIVGMELVSGKAQVESVTLANSVTLTNKTLTAPAVTLLTGTFNSPTGTIGAHTLGGAVTGGDNSVSAINLLDSGYITVAHGDTSGANIALDMNAGQHHSATISTDAVAISVTNAVGADELQCGVLHLTNGGSQSVTFTAGDFAGGTAPTLTSSGLDVLAFWTYDGGTIIHWQVISTDSKSP